MNRRDVLWLAGGLASGALTAGALAGSATADARAHTTPSPSASGPNGSTAATPAFSPLASLPIEGAREAVVAPEGTTVYVAVLDGFAVVDVSDATAPRLVTERRELLPDAEGGPMIQVQEVAVDGDRLLVMGPAHPGSDAVEAAVLFDVSDPADPRQLSVHRTDDPIHNGALRDGLGYLTANDGASNPVEIVDFRGEPTVLGRWSPLVEDDAWAAVPRRLRPCHDVIVRDRIAYCSYWDAGTWLVDVSDSTEPRAIGRVGERTPADLPALDDRPNESTELPGNHHSAAIDETGALLAVGHEAWDADDDGEGAPGGITLVDVSDPAEPEPLAHIEPPSTPDPTFAGVWTSAHNFELRDGVLYSAWYQGGVRVHDVSDPAAPREIASWRDSERARFWTARRAEGSIVAASMGTGSGPAGFYAFPVPDGVPPTTGLAGRRAITATPGTAGVGIGGAAVGGGIAWLLARRRRR